MGNFKMSDVKKEKIVFTGKLSMDLDSLRDMYIPKVEDLFFYNEKNVINKENDEVNNIKRGTENE